MKIGMIGGIGPESTVDYYQRLIKLYQKNINGDDYPDIIIDSINMTAMLKLVSDKNLDGLIGILADTVQSLYKAGADFAFIASNTPHIVFEQVQRSAPIPLVSIVEATCIEANRLALKKVGLLGTLFTMQSSYYQEELNSSGISVVVPNAEEQQYIQQKLFTEIEQGMFLEDTREGLLRIVKRMINDSSIDGIILGCTELPLILTKGEYDIPFLNTTEIHAQKILEKYIELSQTPRGSYE
ncbi:putative racemase YgeA [bioreactor metagenome]|uniref:Putative racemase YgeA n=1 Tax=bioreactor metagenome TaxID=1076179 RepID=A0A644XZJ8_9ZZZZ|nr:amino acid racemase [Candidatus Metalachnospira sp.]